MFVRVRRLYEKHFKVVDLMVAALIVGVVATLDFTDRWRFGAVVLGDNRAAVYQLLAGVTGSLLGFAITAVTIVFGVIDQERFRSVVQSDRYDDLWWVLMRSVKVLALATVASTAALVGDTTSPPRQNRILMYLAILSAVYGGFLLVHCVWILDKIVAGVVAGQKERELRAAMDAEQDAQAEQADVAAAVAAAKTERADVPKPPAPAPDGPTPI